MRNSMTNSFQYTLTELTAETIYVVAFAENEKGRSYGEVVAFNTIPPENQPPVITVLSPVDGSQFTVGDNLEIRIRISDDRDDAFGVRLFIDFMGIASLNGFPYTYTYSTVGWKQECTPCWWKSPMVRGQFPHPR